jgi:hypothetical protein
MICGNGSVATLHPSELFGDDWMQWGQDGVAPSGTTETPVSAPSADDTI